MFETLCWTKHVLLLNKQAGASFHRDGQAPGLIETLRACYPGEKLLPVHRLDKVTSGLLLIARHENAARELSRQFKATKVEKYYLALSDRRPKKKQGWIVGDMRRSRRGTWMLTRGRESPAVTRFLSYPVRPGLRLFVLQPLTGRTHQVRVAMKSLGAPILGDPLYSPGSRDKPEADRCSLHAFAMRFSVRGQRRAPIKAPDFGALFCSPPVQELLASLPKPWELPWPGGSHSEADG